MTMLTCRMADTEATRVREAAETLGLSVSEMIRESLRRYLNSLGAERDAAIYEASPLRPDELSFIGAESWGPAEDWSDWADASG
ncbi:MAG: ribbon-helix-helix protein, CopG family [Acidimicrobiaceae bacterium]|nr:ribbon-helix-helix protein, CopG family [Acidimicrobiaceae bacterium]